MLQAAECGSLMWMPPLLPWLPTSSADEQQTAASRLCKPSPLQYEVDASGARVANRSASDVVNTTQAGPAGWGGHRHGAHSQPASAAADHALRRLSLFCRCCLCVTITSAEAHGTPLLVLLDLPPFPLPRPPLPLLLQGSWATSAATDLSSSTAPPVNVSSATFSAPFKPSPPPCPAGPAPLAQPQPSDGRFSFTVSCCAKLASALCAPLGPLACQRCRHHDPPATSCQPGTYLA